MIDEGPLFYPIILCEYLTENLPCKPFSFGFQQLDAAPGVNITGNAPPKAISHANMCKNHQQSILSRTVSVTDFFKIYFLSRSFCGEY